MTDLPKRVTTGIAGLDDVLHGGLPAQRLYLVEGEPGAGKTTLALQFLLAGRDRGEAGVYVTLSESSAELHEVAASHGWSLEGLTLHEPVDGKPDADDTYTIFSPAEIELGPTVESVIATVDRVKPTRVVFDSLSELRLLAQSELLYRKQVLTLKQVLRGRGCTTLLMDDLTARGEPDGQLRSVVHGVIGLEKFAPDYGVERRRLRVLKLRGVQFRAGYHDYTIERGGLAVYPRLVASEHRSEYDGEVVSTGLPAFDALLGGGLTRGTSVLLVGPSGVGKSAIASQVVVAAAARGERVALFSFDENRETLMKRSGMLGLPLREAVTKGHLGVQQVDPAELSPGEFAFRVRTEVERGARVVVIDSLNGYARAMPEQNHLLAQLHELLSYLSQQGVIVVLVVNQHGLIGNMVTPIDASYLSDATVLFRYFESEGHIRKAFSVLKNRLGAHEDAIRELRFGPDGIRVGEPLTGFRGVLTGVPQYVGDHGELLRGTRESGPGV